MNTSFKDHVKSAVVDNDANTLTIQLREIDVNIIVTSANLAAETFEMKLTFDSADLDQRNHAFELIESDKPNAMGYIKNLAIAAFLPYDQQLKLVSSSNAEELSL